MQIAELNNGVTCELVLVAYLLAVRRMPQDEVLDRDNTQYCSSDVH